MVTMEHVTPPLSAPAREELPQEPVHPPLESVVCSPLVVEEAVVPTIHMQLFPLIQQAQTQTLAPTHFARPTLMCVS